MNARRRKLLRLAVSRLDDVELDGAFEAALRGDMEGVEARLGRVLHPPVRSQATVSWRQTSSWLFNRRPYPKR
jgi:hypothetical protein